MHDHSYLLAISSRGLEQLPALRKTALSKGGGKRLRAFSIWEICQFMLDIPADTLRKKLADDPTLPQGTVEQDGRQRWFTLAQVNELRRRIKFRGRLLLPKRPKGRAIRTVVTNFTPQSGKTTVVQHLAQAAALDGYRVLCLDLDPSAALTRMMGVQDIQETHASWGVICRDMAKESNATLPETVQSIGAQRAQDFIHHTSWPTIDIIPASPNAAFGELTLTKYRTLDPEWEYAAAITRYLDALPDDQYDLILMDCPPAINQQTLNAFLAADILYVPTGPTVSDYENTTMFLRQLGVSLAKTQTKFDAIRLLPTQFETSNQQHDLTEQAYRNSYGADVCAHHIETVQALDEAIAQDESIYELDYRQMTREDWKTARGSFDLAYAEFRETVLQVWQ